jgi:hypothetical protein
MRSQTSAQLQIVWAAKYGFWGPTNCYCGSLQVTLRTSDFSKVEKMNYKEIERFERQARAKSRGRDDAWVRQDMLRMIHREAFWTQHWKTVAAFALFLCFVTIVFSI